MATRRRTSQRRRASTSVIDLTCDLDSDSDGEVLIVGEAAAPTAAAPPRQSDSPVNIVGMVVDQTPQLAPPVPAAPRHSPPALIPLLTPVQPPPPPPVLAATDYPRNSTETQLETELSDLAIDTRLLQQQAGALRPGLERQLRELRQRHSGLSARVSQLTAGRRLRFESLVRPLSAELDEVRRLVIEARDAREAREAEEAGPPPWQQREGGGPIRTTRRSIVLDSPPPLPLPLDLTLDSPPRPGPAPVDKPPASPSDSGSAGGLQCPVCWEPVADLKERQTGFLVTRCGHWFCDPCLRAACQVHRECPICRAKLRTRPPYRPLYL